MIKNLDRDKLNGKRILTHRGYAVPKTALTHAETAQMKQALTVTPQLPAEFAGQVESFPVYYESPSKWYVPRFWGIKAFGDPDQNTCTSGLPLNDAVQFQGSLREEQIDIVNSFMEKGYNGLICVPCGYGKTFMSLWLLTKLRRKTIIIVHKEFLLEQWVKEIKRALPKARVGKLQSTVKQIGDEYDITIAMIQTLCLHEYPEGYFKDFGFAIFDECHHLGAQHFSRALVKIQCMYMLGLSATPDRTDGLSKVFTWYLGDIATRIKHREPDSDVEVQVYKFTTKDSIYTDVPTNYRGDLVRPRLLNQIAKYEPRTEFLAKPVVEAYEEGRKILILSDRREHLESWAELLAKKGLTSIDYYVGGRKQKDLDEAEKARVILGTFSMASEAMNIPTLNTIVLSTPKSNIEQSVGRVLRQKKDERTFAPRVIDCIDLPHDICVQQFNKRKAFYVACGYKITWWDKKGASSSIGDGSPQKEMKFTECMID